MTLPPFEPTVDPDIEVAYVSGQGRPTWPALLADFARRSEEVLARPGVVRDRAYGPHPRQRFDVVPAEGVARVSLVYLHAGYWQMRDRTAFRFLAETFAALGCDTVFADYPLAPDFGVAAISEAVRALVPTVRAEAAERRGTALPIAAAGHSAGGHLAVELALTDPAAWGLATSPIAAVLALSGVYDLEPLVATSLDRALRLDAEAARAASPIHRAGRAGVPALFAVGGDETPAFLDQNRAMADAWRAAGAPAETLVVADADHFRLLDELTDPAGPLRAAVARLLDAVPGRVD